MTDNKFTAMMRECEREALTHAASLHPSSEPSKRFANAAADWRAMREAWEAMVEAITQLCEDADEHDLLRPYVTVDRVLYENLTAALTKARGE